MYWGVIFRVRVRVMVCVFVYVLVCVHILALHCAYEDILLIHLPDPHNRKKSFCGSGVRFRTKVRFTFRLGLRSQRKIHPSIERECVCRCL